jgi:uncharacterized protein (DUF305 family)
MNKNLFTAAIFSLIVGLGLGFAIGRNQEPFKMGPSQEDAVMRPDLGPGDVDFDKRFIDEMIVHHNGAIDMAHQAQQNSNRPEIKKMADDIVQAQSGEINQMKQWREEWYGNR